MYVFFYHTKLHLQALTKTSFVHVIFCIFKRKSNIEI